MSSQSELARPAEAQQARPARRHGLRGRRRIPHGLGQALSRGGAGPPGERRRLLDRPDAGDQPPVPQVRQRDEPRHLRRDRAEGGGLSGRAAAHAEGRIAGLFAAQGAGRSQGLVAMVAVQVRRRLAKTLRAALVRSAAWTTIRSSMSPIATRRPMRAGRARNCRPRPSGSSRRAAGSTARNIAWGEEFTPDDKPMANTWQGAFPQREPEAGRLRAHLSGRVVPA